MPRARRSKSATESHGSPLSTVDMVVVVILALLVLTVLVLMAVRDMNGPRYEECNDGGDGVLSKHLHCVSQNGTGTFADFLAAQGAKKEHPYYAAERERLRNGGVSGGHAVSYTHLTLPTICSV